MQKRIPFGWTMVAAVLLCSGAAMGLTLESQVTNLNSGDQIGPNFVLRGWAYNADPQTTPVDQGLRAFHFASANASNPYPLGDEPDVGAGDLPFGRNSELVSDPTNSNTWWLKDTTSFRSTYGIPGSPPDTNLKLPPYLMRQYINPSDGSVNNSVEDNFLVRMEGTVDIPSAGTYSFSGGGDDVVDIYVDGRPVFKEQNSGAFNGQVNLDAGTHAITLDFIEFSGNENYSASIPGGAAALKATAQDEHIFAGRSLEIGRVLSEQQPGWLTARYNDRTDGSGPVLDANGPYRGELAYWKGGVSNVGAVDIFAPKNSNYHLSMAGYWDVPHDGEWEFEVRNADDNAWFSITNDTATSPWDLTPLADDIGGTTIGNTVSVVLDEGYHPVLFEFGEGGGGERFSFRYREAGSSNWLNFNTADLRSTDDEVHDWAFLGQSPDQVTSLDDLFALNLPQEMVGEIIDLRMTVAGSDLTAQVYEFTNIEVVPEPTALSILGIGGLLMLRRRMK